MNSFYHYNAYLKSTEPLIDKHVIMYLHMYPFYFYPFKSFLCKYRKFSLIYRVTSFYFLKSKLYTHMEKL